MPATSMISLRDFAILTSTLLAGAPACVPGATVRPVDAMAAAAADVTADSAAIDSVARALFPKGLAPGMAMAVVRGDQVIYLGGFGFADREAGIPVTPSTAFYIASTTKAFTGLASAILDRRGEFVLAAPLSRYLPDLRLQAPLSPDSITIRSLLSHTHGISNDGPIVWRTAYTGEFANNAELERLLAEHAAAPQGTAYRYGNIGYNVASFAMDRATGRSWKDILADEIFQPAGMTSTTAYVSRIPAERRAMAYAANGNGFDRVHYGKADANMQAAGGLLSNATDMARWLRLQLNGGRLDGRQVVPAGAVAEAQRMQATTTASLRGLQQIGYSLGWQITLAGTDTLYIHGGGFTGFATHVSFLPGRRLGVVVMANDAALGSALVELTARAIYTRLAGFVDGAGVPADIDAQIEQAKRQLAADRANRAARPQVLPHPIEAYAGTYRNALLGTITLRVASGRLEAVAGAARSAVEVFDGTRNQLRVELSGSGSVMTVELEDGRAARLLFGGQTFVRQ